MFNIHEFQGPGVGGLEKAKKLGVNKVVIPTPKAGTIVVVCAILLLYQFDKLFPDREESSVHFDKTFAKLGLNFSRLFR